MIENTAPGTWERNFADRMQQLRSDKEMNQTDLARELRDKFGLDNFYQQTIARIEQGSRPIRLNEAVLIAQILGVDLDTMISDSGSAQVARGRLDRCTADITVLLDDGGEQLEQLTKELQTAWDAYTSAQKKLGAAVDKKLVHKGLAHTLQVFETRFASVRKELASVIDLKEH